MSQNSLFVIRENSYLKHRQRVPCPFCLFVYGRKISGFLLGLNVNAIVVLMRRKFTVTIEKGEKYFFGEVLGLPGCYSQGKTVKELLQNFKEAIELYISSLKDDNLPLPKSDVKVELREVEVSV